MIGWLDDDTYVVSNLRNVGTLWLNPNGQFTFFVFNVPVPFSKRHSTLFLRQLVVEMVPYHFRGKKLEIYGVISFSKINHKQKEILVF